MSQPDSIEPRSGIYLPKAKPDIYTIMLAIALFAILVAIICLLLEMKAFQWDFKAAGARNASIETIHADRAFASVECPNSSSFARPAPLLPCPAVPSC